LKIPEKKMKCAVVEVNGVALEFLQDKSEDGFLGRFAQEKGDGIHHFCLLSDNIEEIWADTVVLATGAASYNPLQEFVDTKGIP
jgi:hypothetical protein